MLLPLLMALSLAAPPEPPILKQPAAAWRHRRTPFLVLGSGAPNHRGQDVVVAQGAPQVLNAKFAYGLIDKDLKDEDVAVYVRTAAGWKDLGVARTTQDGQNGPDDDGGRVFLTLAKPLPAGRWPVRMVVLGDHSQASFTLYVVPKGVQAVVFDIDGTLTTGDEEIVLQVLGDLADKKYVPKVHSGAAAVAKAWVAKGYLPVYLTGRPDVLRRVTDEWLAQEGFPAGPVHLTDTLGEAAPNAEGVGRFKAAFLERLRPIVGLVAAYGNATTDISAYAAAGIPKARTFIIGKHAGEGGTVALPSYDPAAVNAIPKANVRW